MNENTVKFDKKHFFIVVLSSSERIEKIAEGELGMRKANTEDIVRVEIKGEN